MSDLIKQQIAQALQGMVQEDEDYLVQFRDGKIEVFDAWLMPCRDRYPRIYGHLLSIQEQVQQWAGWAWWTIYASGILLTAVYFWSWEDWFPGGIARLCVYIFCWGCVYVAVVIVGNRIQKIYYRRGRSELFRLMADAGVDRKTLLAMLSDDPTVTYVADELKVEQEASP